MTVSHVFPELHEMNKKWLACSFGTTRKKATNSGMTWLQNYVILEIQSYDSKKIGACISGITCHVVLEPLMSFWNHIFLELHRCCHRIILILFWGTISSTSNSTLNSTNTLSKNAFFEGVLVLFKVLFEELFLPTVIAWDLTSTAVVVAAAAMTT